MFWFLLFVIGWAVAIGVYLVARNLNLMAIVDTIWTTGVGLAAILSLLMMDEPTGRAYLVTMIVVAWSSRLSWHLFKDRVIPRKEDSRYKTLKKEWGSAANRNFLLLFLAQVPFVALFLIPITIAMSNPSSFVSMTDLLAIAVAIGAIWFEHKADQDLAAFKKSKRSEGKVCKNGLWRYSRHPNYFFEWLHWFAYVLFAVGSESFVWSFLGPIAMFVFLRYFTGVPYAERSSLKSRGEAYRQYQKETPPFFPWKPQTGQ